jgi:hypothetical protein
MKEEKEENRIAEKRRDERDKRRGMRGGSRNKKKETER